MRLSEERLNNIIKESVRAYLLNEVDWSKVDNGSVTPYTPEEAARNREAMLGRGENNRPLTQRNPSYAAAIKNNPTVERKKTEFKIPSVDEWREKYKDAMPYREYAKKVQNGEL